MEFLSREILRHKGGGALFYCPSGTPALRFHQILLFWNCSDSITTSKITAFPSAPVTPFGPVSILVHIAFPILNVKSRPGPNLDVANQE
jgi:hypothetical protein